MGTYNEQADLYRKTPASAGEFRGKCVSPKGGEESDE